MHIKIVWQTIVQYRCIINILKTYFGRVFYIITFKIKQYFKIMTLLRLKVKSIQLDKIHQFWPILVTALSKSAILSRNLAIIIILALSVDATINTLLANCNISTKLYFMIYKSGLSTESYLPVIISTSNCEYNRKKKW